MTGNLPVVQDLLCRKALNMFGAVLAILYFTILLCYFILTDV